VVVNYKDSTAREENNLGVKAELAGNALIRQFNTLIINSGLPSDAEVFRRGDAENLVFYFLPKASDIARDLLSKFSSQPCADKPELSGFSKMRL
jgi:hypothetical protein